jgi:hypothetical protein
LDGAVCADGSKYKFFVKYVEDSTDLGITLEPGGACWDHVTCTGQGPGRLGALNLAGIDDDHMTALPPPLGTKEGAIPWGLIYPHFGESDADVPTAGLNQVYFPYCTGDAYTGAFEVTYESTEPLEDSVTIAHQGRANLELAFPWLSEQFPEPGRLHVMGSSAGGLGAMINYALLRDSVEPVCSSFVNDSSPIFVGSGPQLPARQAFLERWRLSPLIVELDQRLGGDGLLVDDMGNLTELLSRAFPEDRFLVTYFQRDLDNSQFAYLGYYEDESTEALFQRWAEDTDGLTSVIDTLSNWGYFIPFFRADNCSHCVALLPQNEIADPDYASSALLGRANGYLRTEIETSGGERVDFRDVLYQVFDREAELPRMRAQPDSEEGFTDEEIAVCRGG